MRSTISKKSKPANLSFQSFFPVPRWLFASTPCAWATYLVGDPLRFATLKNWLEPNLSQGGIRNESSLFRELRKSGAILPLLVASDTFVMSMDPRRRDRSFVSSRHPRIQQDDPQAKIVSRHSRQLIPSMLWRIQKPPKVACWRMFSLGGGSCGPWLQLGRVGIRSY